MIAAFGVPLLSLLVLMNAIVHDTVSTMVVEVCAATLLFTVLWLVRKLLSFQTLARIILAVDGQLAVLTTIMAALQQSGFQVISANKGDETLKVIENPSVHF